MENFKYFRGNSEFQITLNLHTVEVETETRRLRVAWTPELAQDLEAYHNIDAEQELTRILSEEISREIDNNFILPIVRRIAAQTIANDLVAVQPLEMPRDILHYMDFKSKENILTTFKFFN